MFEYDFSSGRDLKTIAVIDMDVITLKEMKAQMALRGNWKEVKRINKMIEFHTRMPMKAPTRRF